MIIAISNICIGRRTTAKIKGAKRKTFMKEAIAIRPVSVNAEWRITPL